MLQLLPFAHHPLGARKRQGVLCLGGEFELRELLVRRR
jgi:hypothetical protein